MQEFFHIDRASEFFHIDKGLTCFDMGLTDLTNGHECAKAVKYAKSFNLNAHYRRGWADKFVVKIRGYRGTDIVNEYNTEGCFITDSGAMFYNSPGRSRFRGKKNNDTGSICTRNIKKRL